MKIHKKLIALFLVFAFANSCSEEFLNVAPQGSLDANVLATRDGVNRLMIGAYAMLDGISGNGFGWQSASSNWVFSSIRGMEANKGTDSGDQPDINPIQTFTETETNPYVRIKWGALYEGIARINEALRVMAVAVEKGTIEPEDVTSFTAQARVLRGHYHFEAWKLWRDIPYIEENTNLEEVTNTVDVRSNIIADLEAGTALPNDMGQVGRFNGTVARVILAKALMQMNGDYAGAQALLQTVVTSGTAPDGSPIGLETNYGDVFDGANRNGVEAIYTVQYSVNDGSGGWNGGWGEALNFPYKANGGSPGECCGFFQPSHDYVNSFLTSGGLPLLDNSYNDTPVANDQGITVDAPFTPETRPLDPRLDWSVGRRSIPYLDWGPHTGQDWIRDQSYAGPYSPKKQVYKRGQIGQITEVGTWTSGFTANGYRMIRFADALLLLAECQIQTGNLSGARDNINLVRARAANPDGFVKNDDGTDAANYEIALYPDSGFPFDNQTNAMRALMMERKLELGMEGHRYFDLQRWGVVQSELSRVLSYEKAELPSLYGNASVGPEDALYPIPLSQIDLMSGRLVQNR